MISKENKNVIRKKKQASVRSKVSGTTERPRLNVYRSLASTYAQIIDDEKKITLCSSSTNDKAISSEIAGKNKTEQAYIIGLEIGKKALKAGIKKVVFDRAGYIYTGRVQKVAEGARKAGLEL